MRAKLVRSAGAGALAVLAGCSLTALDGLSGGGPAPIETPPPPGDAATERGDADPAPDATVDLPLCERNAGALYCNTFDDGPKSTQGWFITNTGSVTLTPSDVSRPNALLFKILSTPTSSTAGLRADLPSRTRLTLSFTLVLPQIGDTDEVSLVRLRLGTKRFNLVARAQSFYTQEVSELEAGTQTRNRPVFNSPLAPQWKRISMTIDQAQTRSILRIDGAELEAKPFASAWAAGEAYFEVGLIFAAGVDEPMTAQIDDVLVTSP